MKKKSKVEKRRLIVFGGVSILGIIYFIVTLTTDMTDIQRLKKQEKKLNQDLSSLKSDAEQLKIEIEKLKDPEYIARFAREHFSYSKENGEYIIKIENKEDNKIEEVQNNKNNYKFLITGIGITLLLIIVYIIKK